MMLRNSISNTKKFFQKTVDNVKSFLSKGTPSTYQRLPKTPPFNPHTTTHGGGGDTELDHFYTEFTHQWDHNISGKSTYKLKNKAQKIKSSIIHPRKTHHHHHHPNHQQFYRFDHSSSMQETNNDDGSKKTPEKRLKMKSEIMQCYSADLCSKSVRERRLNCVTEKMKELENMDKGNSDQKKDVEEFLDCYSRLTCPAYLDIVDKFFKEMSAEFFYPPPSPPPHHHHQHHHHHHHHHGHQQQYHHHHEASPKVNNNYSRPLWKAVKV